MASLGQQLKQAREERGLTIQQIADNTHIGSRFLQAIESDDYSILPGGVFNRAFVRKFAGQVGFDQEQAVKLYDEQLAEMGGEPTKSSYLGLGDEIEAQSSSGNGLLLAFIAVVVLGAILYAAYLAFSPSRLRPETVAGIPTPAPQLTATPEVSPSPEASPSPTPANELRVQLVANNGACWFKFQVDEAKSEEATLQQGDTREFTATDTLKLIRVGNLPALDIVINGKKANLEKIDPARKGVVANNVVITKENYQQFID